MWSNPPDYLPMDVLVLCLSAKYQNLWEERMTGSGRRIITLSSFYMVRNYAMS